MRLLLILSLFALSSVANAQAPDTLWTRVIGSTGWEETGSVGHTPDGGFFIAGFTTSYGAAQQDQILMKRDSNGDAQWHRLYGGSFYEQCQDAVCTYDGGFCLAGYTTSFGNAFQFYAVRTNSVGDTIWTQKIGGVNDERAYGICQAPDGGFLAVGHTDIGSNYDFYVVKLSSNGAVSWTRTYNFHGALRAVDAKPTNDGGFVVVGSSTLNGGTRRSFMESIGSSEVSRIDLVVRWGGRRRLSGLLPVQVVYADFFIVDDLWPDFKPEQFFNALSWYESQDVTLGG